MSSVWILTGITESGDTVGPYAFSSRPESKDIGQYFWYLCASEMEAYGEIPYHLEEVEVLE
jgi:hypothetical protein